ncbi:MAG: hypothetical protein ACI358_03490 [Candidatus Limimorpha sp.]
MLNSTAAINEILKPLKDTPFQAYLSNAVQVADILDWILSQVGVPEIGHTLTFLSIGKFSKSSYAEACLKYIQTRFTRLLLGSLNVTQDNPRDTWANIPFQDFTENSDIDWNKDLAEIEKQLYAKYGLTEEEIAFIESMIKPM